MSAISGRRPHSLYRVGQEPDPRFSLANERTFLAWIRTALAFMAGGVALEALEAPAHEAVRLAIALLLSLVGVLAALQAWLGWFDTERALRSGLPLPGARLKAPIATALAVAGVALAVGLLL